jgi:hypothetical protein
LKPRFLTQVQKNRYNALLSGVPSWPEIAKPDPCEEKFEANDIDGFKVGVIYFKKDEGFVEITRIIVIYAQHRID